MRDPTWPTTITTPDELRRVIQRMETLTSILRMSGHPIAMMPPREEIAALQELLTHYARRTFDAAFVREFHAKRLRRAG